MDWKNRIVGYGEEAPDQLLANPRNFRTHPKSQQDALEGVLKEVGVVQNVLVNRQTGHLIDGHLRVELALRSGQPKVPITYVDLTEKEEAEVLATLDPIAALASADASKLEELLRSFESEDDAVRKLLQNLADEHGILLAPEAEEDEVPPPAPTPRTALGDLYELGTHRLLCGDSTNRKDVERLMNGEIPVLCLTDPPYVVGYKSKKEASRQTTEQSYIDPTDAYELLHGFLSASESTVLVMTFPLARHWDALYRATKELGFEFRKDLVWVKNKFAMVLGQAYHYQHEPILIFTRSGAAFSTYVPSDASSCLFHDVLPSNDEHPTCKPVGLWVQLLKNHTGENELFYEPFCGSGTGIIAAEESGRRCYAMELSPTFCDVIVSRYIRVTGTAKIRLNGQEIVWEDTAIGTPAQEN